MRSDHLDPLEPVPKLDDWEPVGTEVVHLAGKRDL